MNLGGIRSLVQFRLNDLGSYNIAPQMIDTFINEGLRKIAFETLLLEDTDSSLTYSSANDGFAAPTDFIKVKSLHWLDPTSSPVAIPQVSTEKIYSLRRDWLLLNEEAGTYLTPLGYAIHNNYIILDSTTETSPTLYYYKYDTALSADANSPSIDSEFHSSLADYAMYKIIMDTNALLRWRDELRQMNASKFKQGKTGRIRYVGL